TLPTPGRPHTARCKSPSSKRCYEFAPLVIAARGDKAAPGLPCTPEHRLGCYSIEPGVDRLVADLHIFGPHRHEAPAHVFIDPAAVLWNDGVHVLRRRYVPVWTQVQNMGIGQVIEIDEFFPGVLPRKPAAHQTVRSHAHTSLSIG